MTPLRAVIAGGVVTLGVLLAGCAADSGNASGVAAPGATRAGDHAAAVAQQHDMTGMEGMPGMGGATTAASSGDVTHPAAPAVHGFRLNVPLPRPEFTLIDTRGKRYDFGARTRGRVTLLYFGYTTCPDQCPTTMADIASAWRQLPAAQRDKVTVVFVSTDPARDTPTVLGEWLSWYHADVVGLTGSQAAVETAQRAARVTVSYPKPEKTKANAVSTAHGGGALAYGVDDYAHVTYPAGTSAADLLTDLPVMIGADTHG